MKSLLFSEKLIYLNKKVHKAPAAFFVALITLYQWTISPDHGIPSLYIVGQCKFRPTCSQYTKEMISSHGALKGALLGFDQIKRCHS